MACSLLVPTFEKNKIIKNLNKMKVKDIYKLYKSEDNFNIKQYYDYISKLKKHLLSLGFDSKSFISSNFKNIRDVSPDPSVIAETGESDDSLINIDIGDNDSIHSIIETVINKWNSFVIEFRSNMKSNLIKHFEKGEVPSNLISKYIDNIVDHYSNNFVDNTFFYPKNLYNFITNNCTFSNKNRKLKKVDVFRTFYAEIFWYGRIYSGNFYTQTTILEEYAKLQPPFTENQYRWINIIYPCMNVFGHTEVYKLLDPGNLVYTNFKEIGKYLGVNLPISSQYKFRNTLDYD